MSSGKQKTEKAANDGADHTEQAAERIGQAAQGAAAQAAAKASDGMKSVQDAAGRASRAVGDGYERLSGQARESFEHGKEAARRWEREVENSIQKRPLMALLISAVIGMVLGVLLTGHKRE